MLAAATVVPAPGCIIPDRGIQAESDNDNPGAVRIVEPIHVVAELADACREANTAGSGLSREQIVVGRRGCPQIPDTVTQGLIGGGPYCSCPGLQETVLPEFSIYAEDPDRRRDAPADTLYAVALLDVDLLGDAPQNFVAYEEHLTPGGAGELIRSRESIVDTSLPLQASSGREDNGLWRFRFGKDGGVGTDLCNDDNGRTLPPGLHTLQVMVTDRPFFNPVRLDADGEPVIGVDGQPQRLGTQWGMPDLGIGATWSVANYVFQCVDPAEDTRCDCIEEAP
ncbi:MAG: hypothetical protein K0V04_17890 [Deltaproteobacteria bacterium]|nr:hypothetical protein [Deltaproteobacteria bacterium]